PARRRTAHHGLPVRRLQPQRTGLRHAHRGPVAQPPADALPGAGARLRPRRPDHAYRPLGAARGADPGLRAHRARQGCGAVAAAHPSRATQRPQPDRHHDRHPVRLPARRRDRGRTDLLRARHRAAGARRHPTEGVRARAEHGARHRRHVRAGEPAHRPAVPRHRPPGACLMTTAVGDQQVALAAQPARAGAWRRLLRNPAGLIGIVLVALVVGASLTAMLGLTPYDPVAQQTEDRLRGPSGTYWLGTDQFGRDIFSRCLAGMANSLRVAVVAVALAALVGTLAGVCAGYFGDRVRGPVLAVTNVL